MSSFSSSATLSDVCAMPSTRTGLSVNSAARSSGMISTAAAPSLMSEQSYTVSGSAIGFPASACSIVITLRMCASGFFAPF